MNRIITRSREFGSGRRSVGKRVVERFALPYHAAKMIDKIAEKPGFVSMLFMTKKSAKSSCVHGSVHSCFLRIKFNKSML